MKFFLVLLLFIFTSFESFAAWIQCPTVKADNTFRIDPQIDDDLSNDGWSNTGSSNDFSLFIESARVLNEKLVCNYSLAPNLQVLYSYSKEIPAGQVCKLHDNKKSFVCYQKP